MADRIVPAVVAGIALVIASLAPPAHAQTASIGTNPPGSLFYSLGSALGSSFSTIAYAYGGWHGVCLMGAALSLITLLFWLMTEPAGPQGGAMLNG